MNLLSVRSDSVDQRHRAPMGCRPFSVWVLAAVGVFVFGSPALATPTIGSTGTLRGGGGWAAAGEQRRAAQSWDLQVTRDADGRIAGRVALGGSPLAAAGNVEGKLDGRRVWGEIVDDAGQAIASFTGVVTPHGIHGSYRDRTGEAGRWQWDGELP